MQTVGYSGTPLGRKLGFKVGQAVAFIALPPELADLIDVEAFGRVVQPGAVDALTGAGELDMAHAFFTDAQAMRRALPVLRAAIRPTGAIWVSWPKKAAKIETDLTEDVIRAAALAGGLVDVKVCAVSDVWSGLKLVIPVALRPGRG